jgi:hypothetical protein
MEWHGIQAPFEVATKWMRANASQLVACTVS